MKKALSENFDSTAARWEIPITQKLLRDGYIYATTQQQQLRNNVRRQKSLLRNYYSAKHLIAQRSLIGR